jgi:ribosome-associated protein
VNKVSTAVELRFEAERSPHLDAGTKARLRRLAGRRWTTEGALVVTAERHRTQALNRSEAREKLRALVLAALERPEAAAPDPTYAGIGPAQAGGEGPTRGGEGAAGGRRSGQVSGGGAACAATRSARVARMFLSWAQACGPAPDCPMEFSCQYEIQGRTRACGAREHVGGLRRVFSSVAMHLCGFP